VIKLRTSLALGLYVLGGIGLARAAELAGMPLAGFMVVLEKLNIPSVEYTDGILRDDLQFIATYTAAKKQREK